MTHISGAEAIMRIFREEGVEYIFGLPGTTELHFMDALEDHPEISYMLALHETTAVGMAEGYSRISGKVGVVNLHTYAGLAAATPMMLNAQSAGAPLLLTAGQQDTRAFMGEPHLSGDLVGLARHFTKWSTEVHYVDDLPMTIRRAFKVATQPPTGPVFVSLPMDVMRNNLDFEYVPSAPLFNEVCPDPRGIAAAAEMLANARYPVIIAEAGITRNNAMPEIVALAELAGARVYQPWVGDVNFPNRHPLYMGELALGSPPTKEMLDKVDVLVVVGSALFSQPTYFPEPLLRLDTKIIHIDDNPWEIGKNYPITVGISSHIRVALSELTGALQERMSPPAKEAARARADDIAREKERMDIAFLEKTEQERDRTPIAVSRLAGELRDALKPGSIVVDDSISCSVTVRRVLDFTQTKSYIGIRGGGSIGWGMPSALGVKLAAPDRPVVATVGDGSAIWSVQSLWTAAHYRIPVTFVIFANTSYNMLKVSKSRYIGEKGKGRYLGMDFDDPRMDFERIAGGLGIPARRVEQPGELASALKSALDLEGPNLVEVYIAREF